MAIAVFWPRTAVRFHFESPLHSLHICLSQDALKIPLIKRSSVPPPYASQRQPQSAFCLALPFAQEGGPLLDFHRLASLLRTRGTRSTSTAWTMYPTETIPALCPIRKGACAPCLRVLGNFKPCAAR